MNQKHYEVVGWLAIASAILTLPAVVLGFTLDVAQKPSVSLLLGPYLVLYLLATSFSLYALYRFRSFLNDHFQFHDVDGLIMAIIACVIGLTIVGASARVVGAATKLPHARMETTVPLLGIFVGILVLGGIGTSILSIVFAVRLLRLDNDLYGLLKPYAYATIAAAICFASVIFMPLGLIVDAVATILLGVIFLRAARGLPAPDFV